MVSLWRKYKNASARKKQALHSLIAGLLLFGFLYAFTSFFGVPLCPIQNLFGVSCIGCGLTRGFIAVLHFDFQAATQHHVLSIPLFLSIILYASICFSDVLFDRNDVEKIERQCKKKYMLVLFFMLFLLYIFLKA